MHRVRRVGLWGVHVRRSRALVSRRRLALVAALSAIGSGVLPMATPSAALDAPPPSPAAQCGPGSRPEPGLQGRAPAGDPNRPQGYSCNLELVSHFGDRGGYKVHRYVDKAGHECAFYDSTLLFPGNVPSNGGNLTGVHVLDMANPASPVKTANLLTPAMESPHESLELNQARGLLVADMGYPTFNPGFVDIYDVTEDCREPVLKSSTPLGILGHESGFAPDGNTFYVGASGNTTALDITDPTLPKILWVSRDYNPHGIRVSDDGNRLYIADLSDGLNIVDVSEIQSRKANPVGRLVSTLDWDIKSIPQVALPVTIQGRPYLIEIDEFSRGPSSAANAPVGAARIIDIADEKAPKVVSDIRLAVNNPAERAETLGDPGASSILQGYTGHYCAVPRRTDPGIVACSFVLSGLRVFDVRDPLRPVELAYWNHPAASDPSATGGAPTSYAMSAPTFVPERGEIWYADGNSGFWALRFTNGVWPFAETTAAAAAVGAEAAAAVAASAAGRAPARAPVLPATGAAPLGALGCALVAGAVLARRAARGRR